jgi:phospholipid/cholesterol/gamma-HCH transport system substrate-binding protein
MQSVTRFARSWFRDVSVHQRAIGITALIISVVVVAITVIVYLRPPGQQEITFTTDDVASLKGGEDVRVAGVTVGTVDGISLKSDSVQVRLQIDDHVFMGAKTSVDVRMLTAVGGYYVTLLPQGDAPLGKSVIPIERVTVPYSIADVLQRAPRVTGEIDADRLDDNIQEIANGLSGNPGSVGSLISGLDSIASVIDRQRQQVTTTLDLAQSYLETFNTNKEYLFQLIKKIELVLARYNATWQGFNETYVLLGEVVSRIGPVAWFYYENKDRLREAVTMLREGFKSMQDQMSPVIDQLGTILGTLKGIIGEGEAKDLMGNVILATDVCIPLPGRRC